MRETSLFLRETSLFLRHLATTYNPTHRLLAAKTDFRCMVIGYYLHLLSFFSVCLDRCLPVLIVLRVAQPYDLKLVRDE
jgi:hypothetical protein